MFLLNISRKANEIKNTISIGVLDAIFVTLPTLKAVLEQDKVSWIKYVSSM